VGRFAKIGIPDPQILAPFVGVRDSVWRATDNWSIHPPRDNSSAVRYFRRHLDHKNSDAIEAGVLGHAHEARTDFCMVFGLVFLLIAGAGRLSLDASLQRKS
jgi:putative oxidoreductase